MSATMFRMQARFLKMNNLFRKEPRPESEIEQFAKSKGAEFRMMSKVNVNGPDASIVYKYLKKEAGPSSIGWNFGKSKHSIRERAVLFPNSCDFFSNIFCDWS